MPISFRHFPIFFHLPSETLKIPQTPQKDLPYILFICNFAVQSGPATREIQQNYKRKRTIKKLWQVH
jgi:hypothetical protein